MLHKIIFFGITTVAIIVLGCNTGLTAWPENEITLNKIGVMKTLIAENCFRGYVRSIQVGNYDNDSELEIAIVPQTSVFLFDVSTLKLKSKYDFQKSNGDTLWFGLSPFLVSRNNNFSIAMLGGGFGDIGLLDREGKKLWGFKPNLALSPNGMVVDDSVLGKPQFYVCDVSNIYKLDSNGKIVWKVEENASYITVINDVKGNETSFVTANSKSKTLKIWSAAGKLKQEIELPLYPDGLKFVSSGSTSGFVIKSGPQIAFIDRDGKHRFTHSYGSVPVFHGPFAALVHLIDQQPPILAVRTTSRSATGKSVLSMFLLDGTHIYEEYLDGGPSLGVVRIKNENRDRLFVGDGAAKLWTYEKASPNQTASPDGSQVRRP